MDKIKSAKEFAIKQHINQKRADGEDFINHPHRIVSSLMNDYNYNFGDSDFNTLIVLGWLHDVVEDTDTTLKEIEDLFGRNISSRLDFLTRREEESYEIYGKRLLDNEDHLVLLVKHADLRDNLSKIGDGVFSKKKEQMLKERWINLKALVESLISEYLYN